MEYVTLGRTKEKVSRISLGTWSYGGPNTLSGDNPVGQVKMIQIAQMH